jgi:NAD-dependent deacetylase
MTKKKIIFFTGAGISKESGIDTFRDKGGLWDTYKVEEVATLTGWERNPKKVIEFYNIRRKELNGVEPNLAHKYVAFLEKEYDVTIITQNVDDLHEKAGSTNIVHLHGKLTELRSEKNPNITQEWKEELKYGDTGPDGHQLRPNVVWFGEDLNHTDLNKAYSAAYTADICVIVGTSMQVYPACEIPFQTKENCLIYYIDPSDMDFEIPTYRLPNFKHIKDGAVKGMKHFVKYELSKL